MAERTHDRCALCAMEAGAHAPTCPKYIYAHIRAQNRLTLMLLIRAEQEKNEQALGLTDRGPADGTRRPPAGRVRRRRPAS